MLSVSLIGIGASYADLYHNHQELKLHYGYAMDMADFFQSLNDPGHDAIDVGVSQNDLVI